MTDWPAILRAMAVLRDAGHMEHEARLATALRAGSPLGMCRASTVLGDRLREILAGLVVGQGAGATHPTATAAQWDDISALRAARRALASAAWDALLARDSNMEQSTTAYERWSARLGRERIALSAVPALAARPALRALLDAALDVARCRVLVLGNFKRGKSTLINALLGARLLPARMTPATAVLCTLRHAPALRITVSFTDGRPSMALSLPELEDYVCLPDPSIASMGDEEGAARRFRPEVAGVEIGLPWPLLRDGVEVVDSPGLNESGDRGSRTFAALDNADLIVYVLSATEALAADERETVAERLWDRGHRTILFAINYVNRVDEEEELPPVRERLAEGLAPFAAVCASPALHFLGARPALLARLRGDADALAASGVPALYDVLAALTGPHRVVPLRRARLRGLCAAVAMVEDECVGAVVRAVAALARQEEDCRLLATRLAALERARAAAERSDRLRREAEVVRQAEARRARAAVLASVARAIDEQALDQSLTWLLTEMPRWLTDRIVAEAACHDLPLPVPTATGTPFSTATGTAFPLPNWDGSPAMLLVAMPRAALMRDRAAMLAHYHAEARRVLAPPAADDTAAPTTTPPHEDRERQAARRAVADADRDAAALLGQARQALADAATLEALIFGLQGALLQDD